MTHGRIIRGAAAPERALRSGRGIATDLVNPSVGASAVDLHINRVRAGSGRGPYHLHSTSENVYYLLSGRLTVCLHGVDHELSPGDAAFIPPGSPHSVTNPGDEDAVLIEIYAPAGADFVEVADEGSS
jgi:mannose-6-phosphate isomerase-like protein (cupin superfamily)